MRKEGKEGDSKWGHYGRGFQTGAARLLRKLMQTIFQTSLTPEQYAAQKHHEQVKPPENCPNCSRAQSLAALAYYHRYVTYLTDVFIIWVRRFLCRKCQVSVSELPALLRPAVSGHQYHDSRGWVQRTNPETGGSALGRGP